MPLRPARRPRLRGRRPTGILALLAVVALAAAAGCGAAQPDSAPSASTSSPDVELVRAPDRPPMLAGGADLGEEHGALPEAVTVLDEEYAGVSRLDPALLQALRRAARDAAADDVRIELNSGWRSRAYQRRLLDEAVERYGSRAAAARWVATPATSPHVSGHAVDVANSAATQWLWRHGASYGLCRVYANEPWHYELRPGAVRQGCPAPYADPTHDPRMRG